MYMVYTAEEGIVLLTNDKQQALDKYNKEKKYDQTYFVTENDLDPTLVNTLLLKVELQHTVHIDDETEQPYLKEVNYTKEK